MKFVSTFGKSPPVTARAAVLQGLAEDGGLFMPEFIPHLPQREVSALLSRPIQEIGARIGSLFFGDEITGDEVEAIAEGAFTFDAPLVPIEEGISCLELFHGPTCAFKDFGARFLALLLGYVSQGLGRTITVLVATSGDTGSAVASAFAGVPGTRVVLLYPCGLVSDIQEQQLTTFGGNITALEVLGTFDNCQELVKQAFLDRRLRHMLLLASANSMNIARLIPQIVYYIRALGQHTPQSPSQVIFSVPSGNFGNLTAGVFAKRLGFPIASFIAATNVNDVVPEYLRTGQFQPRPSEATMSNAMDVGNPSNFVRLLALYNHDRGQMRSEIVGERVSDEETRTAMRHVAEQTDYVLCPHSAVGYVGAIRSRGRSPQGTSIFLGTAHPAKFGNIVRDVLDIEVNLPPQLAECVSKEKRTTLIPPDFNEFRSFLLDEFAHS